MAGGGGVSTPPKAASRVNGVLGASPGKRVLLVEGPNDKVVYSAWLKKLAYPSLFSAKVVVEDVGGKQSVLNTLEWFQDHGGNPGRLFGLVDRDEWDVAVLAAMTAALPQLRVAPDRDSLESVFCDPDELQPSLQAENAAYVPQLPAFRAHLQGALATRVDHWSLFMTTERLKERMSAALYPGAFHSALPIPPDADIESLFQKWAGLVAHPQTFNAFLALRAQAQAAAAGVQFRSHICAKRFFEEIVHPAPNGLQRFRVKSVAAWRLDLAENAPAVPADIAAILQPLLV